MQGSSKAAHTLAEPLQLVMENGARLALVSLENKRNFLKVSGDIVERVDSVFFSDSQAACAKALGWRTDRMPVRSGALRLDPARYLSSPPAGPRTTNAYCVVVGSTPRSFASCGRYSVMPP